MKFERPPIRQESFEEKQKREFIEALNDRLIEMQESGKLSSEQVEKKKLAALKIETGVIKKPSVFVMTKLAKTLGISIEDLIK